MAFLKIPMVRMDGIATCVPSQKSSCTRYQHLFTQQAYDMFEKHVGISSVRIAEDGCTTSDLCLEAAQKLLAEMNVNKNEIDLLILVSQTPDYLTPMTSCILQQRLGLSKSCIAFDVTSGCSGYVQGVSIAASMLSSTGLRRALLLSGDTTSIISPNDKTVYPVFGAAGSATLLSFDLTASDMYFESGTDGSGADAIMIRDGGCRNPFSVNSLAENFIAEGVIRNNSQLTLKGEEVFSFAISEVPDSIERLYSHFGLETAETDYFVFHQANKMILETVADLLGVPLEKVPMSLKDFGNTSSASIPLTIVTQIGSINSPTKLCLCGFGVGLSWASLYFQTDGIRCCELVEIGSVIA